jgi:hypothetical protein
MYVILVFFHLVDIYDLSFLFFPASAIFNMPSIVISGPTESPLNSVLMMSCEVLGLEYEFREVELESGENLNLMVICLCLVIETQYLEIQRGGGPWGFVWPNSL